jgi:hypothetical protein
MFNSDKLIGCSITFHFKDLKINYGLSTAFWRPRQGSNGINSEAVYAGISLPLRRLKASFVGELMKKISF